MDGPLRIAVTPFLSSVSAFVMIEKLWSLPEMPLRVSHEGSHAEWAEKKEYLPPSLSLYIYVEVQYTGYSMKKTQALELLPPWMMMKQKLKATCCGISDFFPLRVRMRDLDCTFSTLNSSAPSIHSAHAAANPALPNLALPRPAPLRSCREGRPEERQVCVIVDGLYFYHNHTDTIRNANQEHYNKICGKTEDNLSTERKKILL